MRRQEMISRVQGELEHFLPRGPRDSHINNLRMAFWMFRCRDLARDPRTPVEATQAEARRDLGRPFPG